MTASATETEKVSGYTLLEPIGQGGIGTVYRAHPERDPGRIVAVKVLSVEQTRRRGLKRFARECLLPARLSAHQNVVAVLAAGVTRSGRPYIVSEFYEGGTLADRLGRIGPLPLREVLGTGMAVAGALAAAHEAGIVHGDVKPGNVLLSASGEPALADFCVARLADLGESPAEPVRSPAHLAPEVLNGQPHTPASDVYSLGSTLYELLAGRPAFHVDGRTAMAQFVLRVLTEDPPGIARPDVPAPVLHTIRQAMAKDPAERPPTALALAELLADLIVAGTRPAPPPSPAQGSPDGGGPDDGILVWTIEPPLDPGELTREAPRSPDRLVWPVAPALPRPESGTPPLPAPASPPVTPNHQATPPLIAPASPPATPNHQATPQASPFTTPNHQTAPPLVAPASPPVAASRQSAPPFTAGRPRPPGIASTSGKATMAGSTGPAEAAKSSAKPVVAAVLAFAVVIGIGGVITAIVRGGPVKLTPAAGEPGTEAPATPGPTAPDAVVSTEPSAPPSARPSKKRVDPATLAAARPRALKLVTDNGATVTLSWRLARRSDYPMVLQRSPGAPALTTMDASTSTFTVGGLDPATAYCFKAGVVVALGRPSTVAWSPALCIRGGTETGDTGDTPEDVQPPIVLPPASPPATAPVTVFTSP
ncbi:serine/threonine-protein kinase [Streptosporangium sp. KLBMP 9127]|nr:protein kinase [Streptosporangium sp. KLBMP 9127]